MFFFPETFCRRQIEFGHKVGISGRMDRLFGAAGAAADRAGVGLQLEGPLPLVVLQKFLQLVDVTDRSGTDATLKLRRFVP
jgi:hypothetical protein